jgi:orotate phosphoribosyltransferase
MGLPFVYVRSSRKNHGLENKIEGQYESGQRVVVIEDLISTGKSSLDAVEALRSVGCDVRGMVAVFSYNLEKAKENFKKAKCPLFTLSDYNILVEYAENNNYITENDLKSLAEWRTNPEKWSEERVVK